LEPRKRVIGVSAVGPMILGKRKMLNVIAGHCERNPLQNASISIKSRTVPVCDFAAGVRSSLRKAGLSGRAP
jgi:hypothetical protein